MKQSPEKMIAARMEEHLTVQICYQDLKTTMEELFQKVSILATQGFENGNFPYDVSEELIQLRYLIKILDVGNS